MSDGDDKIVSLGKDGHEPQFSLIKSSTSLCRHYALDIDEFNRVVACASCGRTLDPFDWLVRIANEDISLRQTIKWRRQEEDRIFQRVEVLKREERNVKARLKRAKNQLSGKGEQGG